MSEFRRETEWRPAFDRRSEGSGQGAVEIRFLIKGGKGAVQFLLFTGWYLDGYGKPTAADIGYHSLAPQYKDQPLRHEACPYLDGRPCYYDGSGALADKVFDRLVQEGEEAMWTEMERLYHLWLEKPSELEAAR